jgi:hypothetical protein
MQDFCLLRVQFMQDFGLYRVPFRQVSLYIINTSMETRNLNNSFLNHKEVVISYQNKTTRTINQ